MSVAVTWAHIHPGDTVRGADQRVWTVTGREPGPRWLIAGAHDRFTMRLDGREVTTTRKLIDPAAVVRQADHSAEAAAWAVLASAFTLEPIGESVQPVVQESVLKAAEQAGVTDPFAAPAGTQTTPGDQVKQDRYGRYLLPHPETGKEQAFTRVSTIARTLADEYHLNRWKLRKAVKGVAIRPDLLAAAAAADEDDDKKALDSLADQAMDAAEARKGANMGNAFHQAARRLDRGIPLESMSLPAELAADVSAYAEQLRAKGIRILPEYMERVVFTRLPDGTEIVGTLDRIASQPPGVTKSEPRTVIDLKSGKDLSYSWLEIEIQQAFYANASYMWDREKRCWVVPPLSIDKHRALIAWAPVGKAQTQILGVDINHGWRYAQVAVDVRQARKARGWLLQDADPAAVALHLVSTANSTQELAQLWDRYHPRGMWTTEVNAAAASRWEHINQKGQPS